MSSSLANELIPVIIFYLVLTIFLFFAYRFLRRRKKRHFDSYQDDFSRFKKADLNDTISDLNYFGDRIIWNEYLEQHDKKTIYEAVKNRVVNHPELGQLWKDVHYKTHGHEPFE
jgi:flagellar biosynthesis/type III secretory pathway M-ring protein FliF/YscJ